MSDLAPRTPREWRLYHRGFVEGVRRAQADAAERAAYFGWRAKAYGVELDFPAAQPVQTSAPKKRRTV